MVHGETKIEETNFPDRFEPRYLLEGSSHSTTDTQSEVRGRGGCRTEQQLLTTYSTEELYFTVRTVVPCWTAL